MDYQVYRAACEELIAVAPTSRAYSDPERVFVGVDENLQHSMLATTLRDLVKRQRVFMAQAIWFELREGQSGDRFTTTGSTPTGLFHGHDFGSRIKHDSWPDEEVVNSLLVHLHLYRRVVFLSEDRRLRTILRMGIGPVLNSTEAHKLSLCLLYKRGKTTMADYCMAVYGFLDAGVFPIGYHEPESRAHLGHNRWRFRKL